MLVTRQRYLSPRVAYLLAIIASAVVVFFLVTTVRFSRETALSNARLQVSGELGQLRSRLEGNVYLNANLVQGLAAAIATEPNMGQNRFSALARYLFQGRNQLRNIGGAPDLVIRLMFPLEGNEGAIGLDFTKDGSQQKAALQARDTGRMVMAGPVALAQGGEGVIARVPVFNAAGTPQPGAFWGLISTVISVQQLYDDSGLPNAEKNLEIAIRGKDGTGGDGEFFYGDPNIANKDPVTTTVFLPNGEWQLLAVPRNGWPRRAPDETQTILTYLIGGAFIVIPLLLVGRLLFERRGITQALIKAREKADAANNAKSQFLANMSHEVRTPMNAVIGLSYLAKKTALSDQQRDYVNKIHSSATALLGIINDILDISKIEAGKLELESAPFYLQDVLTEVSDVIMFKAHEKGLELLFSVSAEVPGALIGDSLRLRQIILNLVSNAVKFAERGEIVVAVKAGSRAAGHVTLQVEVSDSGIGMTEEQLSRLFKAFNQADGSTTRKYGGTGLGLAITKELVGKMQGEIGVRSVQGSGSTFFFTASFGVQDVGQEGVTPIAAELRGTRVLLVDDNHIARNIISEMLCSLGCEVTAVDSGAEAIEVFGRAAIGPAAEAFGAVVLDWMMPGLDGVETARRLLASGEGRAKPPVLLMATAYDRSELVAGSRAAGVTPAAILAKPLNASQIFDALSTALGGDRIRASVRQSSALDGLEIEQGLKGVRVLVVDDNEINRQVAQEILEGIGVRVEVASNGQEAVIRVASASELYDAVLMDLQMPVMDGFTATARIRQDFTAERLPVIAMTAHASAEEKQKCLAAGMNDHVAKPINPEDLFATLKRWTTTPARATTTGAIPNTPPAPSFPGELPETIPGFDLVEGLKRFGGNAKLMRKLLEKFLNANARVKDDILAAVAERDAKKGENLAHAMKGTSGNLGADRLYLASGELEAAFRDGRWERVEELAPKYSLAHDEVMDSLRKLFNAP